MKHKLHIEPRISVVIPAFNREKTIGRAIESALAQTRPPFEIIVVDDGSSDSTAAVVTAFRDSVRYVRQPNAGASAARNRGVELAGAPWVAFLDSDDYWFDDHLERMAEAIVATGGAASFYFADTKTDDGTSWWELSGFPAPTDGHLFADATDWMLLDVQPPLLQSSVFSRERYRKAGGLWNALQTRHDTHLFFVMGIGSQACAVAGGGVRMTGDDRSGRRLTHEFGPTSRNYWVQTREMFADVLNRFPLLARNHRRRLKTGLAQAYLCLAKDDWREGRRTTALVNLLQAVHLAPWPITVSGGRKVWRLAFTRRRRDKV